MTIGPVQLLVLGFQDPQFKGEILEELKRLKEEDIVRVIDAAVVKKNEDGTVETLHTSDLSEEEAQEFGAVVGALIGLGYEGEEGAEAGAAAGAKALEDRQVFDDDEVWYVLEGDYRFKIGESMFSLSKGGLAFGPRGMPHAFQNVGDAPGRLLVITTPADQQAFRRLLGDGSQFGLTLDYAVQPEPGGIAQAFLIGRQFIGRSPVALALGDNLFYGHGLPDSLRRASERTEGATIFAYFVRDPERYGVVEFDAARRAVGIEEKPATP